MDPWKRRERAVNTRGNKDRERGWDGRWGQEGVGKPG